LGCDLMWMTAASSSPAVNRKEKGECLSDFPATRIAAAATTYPSGVDQYRSTIRSSFLLSNQDRPRNKASMTMPRPEEALLMDFSET
jgi:hypothetical protein